MRTHVKEPIPFPCGSDGIDGGVTRGSDIKMALLKGSLANSATRLIAADAAVSCCLREVAARGEQHGLDLLASPRRTVLKPETPRAGSSDVHQLMHSCTHTVQSAGELASKVNRLANILASAWQMPSLEPQVGECLADPAPVGCQVVLQRSFSPDSCAERPNFAPGRVCDDGELADTPRAHDSDVASLRGELADLRAVVETMQKKIIGGGAFGGVPLVLAGPDCTSSLGDGHPKEFCGSSTAWRAPHGSATLDDRTESTSFARLARLVGEMDATLRTDLAILLHQELDKLRREIRKVPENIPAAETKGSAPAGSLPRTNREMKCESTAAKLGSEWRAAINMELRHVSLPALANKNSPAPWDMPRRITHRAGSQVGPPQLVDSRARNLSPAPCATPMIITHRAGSQVGPPRLVDSRERIRNFVALFPA
mmetsp:Transcript_162704/g.516948  ORF Transcript_162704/g.516948 Transcript_162704/m.516948 type:complete len:427 (+) Transcript_162704:16-1296(+)